ncbi:MAG: hypothetical protein ABJQ37_19565 [Reichenbachiella sp.]|uniref:hypothetical protein n=2 Tax=Reichenbachiella sp. TaxID=2184521 RepID=UPI0032999E66
MKKVVALGLCVFAMLEVAFSQSEKINNGYNLESYCSLPDCKYFKFNNNIGFPQGKMTDWEMMHAEIAVKNTGSYLLTGDMDIKKEEMGVRLTLDIEFFNAGDDLIHTAQTALLEYYSEPNYAEPIVVKGEIPQDVIEQMAYLNFLVVESETVPYYELATNCYGPCNNYQLNASIKAFKKSK